MSTDKTNSSLPTFANGVDKSKNSKRNGKKKSPGTAVTLENTGNESLMCQSPSTTQSPALKQHESLSSSDETLANQVIRDLQKNIRSINKKLNMMHKLDAVIAENPGLSLDELVAQRKINSDQKAQGLKKPSLQASLAQMEEQLATIRKIEEDHLGRLVAEKDEREKLQSRHQQELEKMKSDIEAEVTAKVWAEAKAEYEAKANAASEELIGKECQATSRRHILLFSQFLRTAASHRQHSDPNAAVSQAFEGLLLSSYSGDQDAVTAVEKFITGSNDRVLSTSGDLLGVTYSELKNLTLERFSNGDAEMKDMEGAASEQKPAPGASTSRLEDKMHKLSSLEVDAEAPSELGVPPATGGTDPEVDGYTFVSRPEDSVTEPVNANPSASGFPSFVPDQGDGPISAPHIPADGGHRLAPTGDARRGRWSSFRSGDGRGGARGGGHRSDGRGRGWGRGRGNRGGFRADTGGRGTA